MGASKWDGKPLYDIPLGKTTEGIDDGRPVVTVSDFSVCTPAECLSEQPETNRWRLIDFATDQFEGKMLHAPHDKPAPEVTIPLNVKGWYAVYVWLMGGDVTPLQGELSYYCRYSRSKGPGLKLTKDKCFSGMFQTMVHSHMAQPGLEACFWRYEDMTDQSITIRHHGGTVYIGAIELIPLSLAEVEAIEKDRADTSNKRLMLKGDEYFDMSWIEDHYEHLRHTDLFAWITGCERHAELMRPEGSVSMMNSKRGCEELGLEWYVCDRPSLWTWMYDNWHDARIEFFDEHPEYRCQERDGTPTNQLSYAIPEVREFMLNRARAVAKHEPDGFGYFLNRDPGMLLFEPAAIEGFEEKYGVDPRTLDDLDNRLLDWRAEIITSYMHKVRQALDKVSKERGSKRIKGVQVVLGSEAANRRWSYDVKRWVKEGLIDVLVVMQWADHPEWRLAQGHVKPDLKYFKSITEGTDIPVISMWFTWGPETNVRPNEYFTRAIEEYANGADGLSGWDHVGLETMFSANRWLRLGHKEKLSEWAEADDFPLPPYLRITRQNGKTVGRFQIGAGG